MTIEPQKADHEEQQPLNQSAIPAQEPPKAALETPQKNSWWVRLGQSQRENVQILIIALVLAVLIRMFVAEPRYIPSDSMVPTLQVGDRLVVEKVSYRFQPPQTGDIIVFDPPHQLQEFGYSPDKAFIKRIIGTPGDTVQVAEGTVYLNGQPLQENYIAEPLNYQLNAVRVPENQFFVMGDNRNNSNDSHVWGFLPEENIIGRAVFRFFPFSKIGLLKATAAPVPSELQVVHDLSHKSPR